MTTSFADYAAQQDARNTIQLNVTKWTLMLCDALKDAAPANYDYIIESGRKYHKIIMVIDNGPNRMRPSRSVHAFVDKKTGEVYKSAGWKAPAKGVRYDLRIIEQREWLLENADWAGSYLYAK
jgi:hypothetical protein